MKIAVGGDGKASSSRARPIPAGVAVLRRLHVLPRRAAETILHELSVRLQPLPEITHAVHIKTSDAAVTQPCQMIEREQRRVAVVDGHGCGLAEQRAVPTGHRDQPLPDLQLVQKTPVLGRLGEVAAQQDAVAIAQVEHGVAEGQRPFGVAAGAPEHHVIPPLLRDQGDHLDEVREEGIADLAQDHAEQL